jgi:hypothetical protein
VRNGAPALMSIVIMPILRATFGPCRFEGRDMYGAVGYVIFRDFITSKKFTDYEVLLSVLYRLML